MSDEPAYLISSGEYVSDGPPLPPWPLTGRDEAELLELTQATIPDQEVTVAERPPLTMPQVGTRVIAARGRRRLTGVLLPAAASGGLRVHADDGRVVDITKGPGTWAVAAEQGLAERKADRRRTECPAGRPLYRHGGLPAVQLATVTMLKRARRRLGNGQEPIASYKTYRDYAPLYAVADTVPLPALSPKRQAARDTARTCVRCGARRGDADHPYARWHRDGQRYCEPCREPVAQEWWDTQRTQGRQAAAEWAVSVLADPHTVLIHTIGSEGNMTVHAETLDGQVLISAHLYRWKIPTWWTPEAKARAITPADALDALRGLADRRIITWRDGRQAISALSQTMAAADPNIIALSAAEGDEVGPHWDEWIGERSTIGLLFYSRNDHVRHQAAPRADHWLEATAVVVPHMRQSLTTMATAPQTTE